MISNVSRRGVLGGLAASALLPKQANAAWPERPITLIHGFGVGGNADVISRIVADRLSVRLGQPVVVEAKAGAGGRVAAQYTARAPADGYTLVVLPGGHAVGAAIYESLPFDPVNDFSFVSMLTDFPFILATYPDHPVKSVGDLITAAKAARDPMIYGSAGNGTGQHLSGALFAAMANIPLQHLPFRGGAPGSTELLGKRIDFLFETPTLLLELIRSGQLRAVAVTGAERFFALPDVATIGETVPGYSTSSWLGLAAPPKLPADLVRQLHAATIECLKEPSVEERFRALGNLPTPTAPEQFRQRVANDVTKWTKVVVEANIKRLGGAQ